MRKLIFGGLFAGAASLFPITAGAEPFSAYWSSLSIAEKSLVDRIAEDLFSEQEMQDPGVADAFGALSPALKAHFRARAVEELGVDPAVSGAADSTDI
ncbi:MAG: hypothetical protein R3C51_05420 [Parvularculaceae bacterium]